MSKKTKLIGWLFVIGTLIQSYLGQISHVSAEQVAKWGYHEWTGSLLYVLLAGITSWKAYITNPGEAANAPAISRPQTPDPRPVSVDFINGRISTEPKLQTPDPKPQTPLQP